ncbi:ABC transporter permease [Pinisolibacter sp.]|uniref:ABC transporter permease n=1 Tax=Pinisolibacter sp. TaxID=2172024 RepID=UPI002FDCE28F
MAGSISGAELKRGFALQSRIVGALILREMRTRFGERQFGYAWALLEPLVQIGILSGMFFLTGARPPLGGSYETFFLTGFITFAFFRGPATQAAQSITANRALLSFPPVRNIDTVWARIILEVVTNIAALGFVVLIFVFLEIQVAPNDPLRVTYGLLSMTVLGAGFGIFNAIIATFFKSWMMLWGWFMRVQYFTTGIFFIPEKLPPFALEYMKWNPSMQGVIIVREGFYNGYKSALLIESLPFVVGLSFALLGLVIERLYRRRVSRL